MSELFEVKIRKIGTSVGVLFPKEIVREENLEVGKKVGVALIPSRRIPIENFFGMAKSAKSFKRIHGHRD